MVGMRKFCAISDKTIVRQPPEVANVAYITVIDEKQTKDTVLHIINELYTKYV